MGAAVQSKDAPPVAQPPRECVCMLSGGGCVEITTQQLSDAFEVRVKGRLDAYWADHLAHALEDAVRSGAHRIQVNMAEVVYMSSVGIRVLLKFYKQLQRINGALLVSEPSEPVKSVLELAGLQVLLVGSQQLSILHGLLCGLIETHTNPI